MIIAVGSPAILSHYSMLASSRRSRQYVGSRSQASPSAHVQDLKAVERNLQQEARNADLLLIWTDCDREGEHIGSEVAEVCRRANPRIRVKRARFSAIIAG